MAFFILFLLLIMFQEVKVADANGFMKDYLSKEKTNAIKGIFVILIIFSHYSQYVKLGGIYDKPYMILKNHLNQMVVSMFFFYSGYGMMEATKKKGFEYIKGIPVKRFFTVLLNFDIEIVLFLIVGWFLGKTYDIKTILWSLIGWKSVGNSNWYIFAILGLYLIYFLAYFYLKWFEKYGEKGCYVGTILLTVGACAFVYFQMKVGRPGYAYNTIILLPLGCWYSLLKKPIEKLVMHNDFIYTFTAMVVFFVYYTSFGFRWKYGIEGYSIWAITFTLMVVLLTMKISFCNPVLSWFGNHVFSIYILQRIPMMILQYRGLAASHKYIFLIMAIISTIFLAMVFDYFTGKLSNLILSIYQKWTVKKEV